MINSIFQFYWQPVNNLFTKNSEEINSKAKWTYGTIIVFYGFVFLVCVNLLEAGNWNYFKSLANLYNPKWPIMLFQQITKLDIPTLIKSVVVFSAITSTFGLFFGIKYRIVRVLTFIGILFHVALINSFGKGGHSLYLSLWCSFLLIFIPSLKLNNCKDQKVLFQVLYTIRTFILLTYFSSGCFKFFRLIQHLVNDKMTALNKFGFPNLIAKDWYLTGKETILGQFIINNESYFWVLVLMTGYMIEILSIFVVFYPRIDKIWTITLLVLHLGIMMTLGPNFVYQLMVVILFLFFNVFSAESGVTKRLIT